MLKEFALQSIVDYGVQHGINRLAELQLKDNRGEIESSVREKIDELFRNTDQQVSQLMVCDLARNNGHYQSEITNAANSFLRCNRSIILAFTRQLSHAVAMNDNIDTKVRLVAAAGAAGQMTVDISGIMSLTDNFCNSIRDKIESLAASAPNVATLPSSSSSPSAIATPSPDPALVSSMKQALGNQLISMVTGQIMGRVSTQVMMPMSSYASSYAVQEVRGRLKDIELKAKEATIIRRARQEALEMVVVREGNKDKSRVIQHSAAPLCS